jgi:cytochrome c oxidase subunit 2
MPLPGAASPGGTASLRWSACALLSITALPVVAAQTSFEYCTVCHGANGNGNLAIRAPKIAGIEPWYLKSQFAAFKAGWRGAHPDDAPGNEMRPVAAALSDAEVDRALAYVASFSPRPSAVTVNGDASHGQALYGACAACHGTAGQGNQSLHAPALAGRTDWYLVTQLHNYRTGLRGADPADSSGQQMRAMAATLADDAAVNDVVAYINTLR